MAVRRVVVTGLGVITPVGNDVQSYWEALIQGKSGIAPVTSFDTAHCPVKVAAQVHELDAEEILGKHDAKYNSRFMQFARIAAKQAYAASGLHAEAVDPDRFGVYVSTSIGGIEALEQAYSVFDPHTSSRVSPYLIPNTLVNVASGAIAIDLQAKGPNLAVVTACASGTNSIGEAFKAIQRGDQDVIVAGAADAAITPLTLSGFAAMRAMYTGDDPNRACIPFDSERSGTVMGEGAGILILEELEHAQQRGAPILAEIVGYGANCDAYSITTPELEGITISKAMQLALDDAHIASGQVGYVNAHGTATVLNDKTESRAIERIFGPNSSVPVTSVKSMTGHLLGAGGAVEAVASIMSLIDNFIPPTINNKQLDPDCKINVVVNNGVQTELDFVLSNSFGFGGHNACLVFKKWPS